MGPIQNDDDMIRKGLANKEEDYHKTNGGKRWFPLLFFSSDMAQATGQLMGTLSIPSIDNDVAAAEKKTYTQRWVMSSLLHCMEALHHNAK